MAHEASASPNPSVPQRAIMNENDDNDEKEDQNREEDMAGQGIQRLRIDKNKNQKRNEPFKHSTKKPRRRSSSSSQTSQSSTTSSTSSRSSTSSAVTSASALSQQDVIDQEVLEEDKDLHQKIRAHEELSSFDNFLQTKKQVKSAINQSKNSTHEVYDCLIKLIKTGTIGDGRECVLEHKSTLALFDADLFNAATLDLLNLKGRFGPMLNMGILQRLNEVAKVYGHFAALLNSNKVSSQDSNRNRRSQSQRSQTRAVPRAVEQIYAVLDEILGRLDQAAIKGSNKKKGKSKKKVYTVDDAMKQKVKNRQLTAQQLCEIWPRIFTLSDPLSMSIHKYPSFSSNFERKTIFYILYLPKQDNQGLHNWLIFRS